MALRPGRKQQLPSKIFTHCVHLTLDVQVALSYKKNMAWSCKLDGQDSIRVRFEGYLDEDGGLASATEVAQALDDRPRELVLEVEAMTGYKRGARLAWQKVLWGRRHLISRMLLVGGNSVVRMGGNVMAMFLGVPVACVEGEAAVAVPASARPRRRERSWAGVAIPRVHADSHAA